MDGGKETRKGGGDTDIIQECRSQLCGERLSKETQQDFATKHLGFVDEVDEACGIGTVSPEKSGHKRKYCSRKTKRKNVLRSMEMDRSATKDAIG